MTTPNKSRSQRALGFCVASVVAATPSLGCTQMHLPSSSEDAATSPVDASAPVDAFVAHADTGPEDFDAGLPTDAQPPIDAWAAEEDADRPDAYYYPDGIRG